MAVPIRHILLLGAKMIRHIREVVQQLCPALRFVSIGITLFLGFNSSSGPRPGLIDFAGMLGPGRYEKTITVTTGCCSKKGEARFVFKVPALQREKYGSFS